jgi:hypothetical protein
VALQKRLQKDENNLDNAADVIHGNWLQSVEIGFTASDL